MGADIIDHGRHYKSRPDKGPAAMECLACHEVFDIPSNLKRGEGMHVCKPPAAFGGFPDNSDWNAGMNRDTARAHAEAYPDRLTEYCGGRPGPIEPADPDRLPGLSFMARDVDGVMRKRAVGEFYAKSGGLWEKNADGQGEYVATGRTHADCERLAAILNSAIAMALGIAARYQK